MKKHLWFPSQLSIKKMFSRNPMETVSDLACDMAALDAQKKFLLNIVVSALPSKLKLEQISQMIADFRLPTSVDRTQSSMIARFERYPYDNRATVVQLFSQQSNQLSEHIFEMGRIRTIIDSRQDDDTNSKDREKIMTISEIMLGMRFAMDYHPTVIEFFYGVVVGWEDLKRKGWVAERFVCKQGANHMEEYLKCTQYIVSYPSVSGGLEVRMLKQDLKTNYLLNKQLVDRMPPRPGTIFLIIGVPIRTFRISGRENGWIEPQLDLEEMINSRTKFLDAIPQPILDMSGKPNIHTLTR